MKSEEPRAESQEPEKPADFRRTALAVAEQTLKRLALQWDTTANWNFREAEKAVIAPPHIVAAVEASQKSAACWEVATRLAQLRRLLDQPHVLLRVPRPERLQISKLLHEAVPVQPPETQTPESDP